MATSLEELRAKTAIIDTTQGKVEPPAEPEPQPTLAETDPAFMNNNTSGAVKGGQRTPTVDGSPSIKVVNARFDPTSATEFDINSLEKRKKEPSQLEQDLMSDLNAAVEREKQSITERIDALTDKQREEFEAKQEAEEEKEYTANRSNDIEEDEVLGDDNYLADSESEDTKPVEDVSPKIVVPAQTRTVTAVVEDESDIDESDIVDEDEDDTPSFSAVSDEEFDNDLAAETGAPDMEAIFKSFSSDVKHSINPIKNKIDLNSFKISNSKITNIADHLSFSKLSVADHFLPNAGKVVSCSALSGSELINMNPENSTRNRLNTMRDIYSIMYKHVVSDKPKSFDEWLKTTRYNDLDHIYFALYKATFDGSHFMHYECPNEKCKEMFIQDVPFEDMIVYADDDIKKKMQDIMTAGDSSAEEYEVILHQISDEYVVGLRMPSIYNVVIEVAGLSDEFLTKYSDLMDVISYVDSIYFINHKTHSLDPIDLKPDKDSLAKTVARRIKIMSSVLRNLHSDNYYELRKCIVEAYPTLSGVTYTIPETTCKKCGTKIPATPIEAQQLLFMRHQLGVFAAL